MSDPAWGRSKAERALGEHLAPKKKVKPAQAQDLRRVQTGQFDGPRASYGRYNVSEQSADILNRSKRNMDMR